MEQPAENAEDDIMPPNSPSVEVISVLKKRKTQLKKTKKPVKVADEVCA